MLDYQNLVLGRTLSQERILHQQPRADAWFNGTIVRWGNPLRPLQRLYNQFAYQVASLNRQRLRERRT
jgi:hypothetical protein